MIPPRVVNMHDGPCDLCIMRPNKWGNPFEIGVDGTREECVLKFRVNIIRTPLIRDLHELEGLALGCGCKPLLCHGDVLVQLFIAKYCNGTVQS